VTDLVEIPSVPAIKALGDSAQLPRVAVSIVAWKGADLTIACLESVLEELKRLPGWRVYVIDNASPDDSADRVEAAIRDRRWDSVTFVRSKVNGGFAAGNNIAIRATFAAQKPPDFVLLLNPDTLVRPGAFRKILDFMLERPDIGIAGGRSEDPDATPQCCSFRFPSIVGEVSSYLRLGIFDRVFKRFLTGVAIPNQPQQVDWVSGAFMMIRREVIESIGLMDEGYFLYYEETDYILRARRAGWTCWHVPDSRIVHLVGQSSGVTVRDVRPSRRPKYWFDSRRRYFTLNHGRAYAAMVDLLVLIVYPIARLRFLIQRKRNTDPPHLYLDLVRNSAIVNGPRSLKPRQCRL
jgi:N-acetylglucosaminyl-diphospho-decaprenol L-rhamnosyltransferase